MVSSGSILFAALLVCAVLFQLVKLPLHLLVIFYVSDGEIAVGMKTCFSAGKNTYCVTASVIYADRNTDISIFIYHGGN